MPQLVAVVTVTGKNTLLMVASLDLILGVDRAMPRPHIASADGSSLFHGITRLTTCPAAAINATSNTKLTTPPAMDVAESEISTPGSCTYTPVLGSCASMNTVRRSTAEPMMLPVTRLSVEWIIGHSASVDAMVAVPTIQTDYPRGVTLGATLGAMVALDACARLSAAFFWDGPPSV